MSSDFMNRQNTTDPVTAVRRRPGMYFGDRSSFAYHVVKELVANALDQHLMGLATEVEVQFDGEVVTVRDDGPGMVFDDDADVARSTAMRCLTVYHTSASAHGHAPHVHLASFGVGLMPVVAVCERFEVESWRDGVRWHARFHEGRLGQGYGIRGGILSRGKGAWVGVPPKCTLRRRPERAKP